MASPPSPDLTRHQLDELDALLQRMLNLPLAPAPRPAPVPPPPAAPREPIALPDNWRDDDLTTPDVVPFAEPRTLRGVDAPALPMGYKPEVVDDDHDLVSLDSAPTLAADVAPRQARPSVPLLLWPVAALSAVLEWVLSLFGPLGAWACSPGAKTVLGVTGVAMLAAAGLWAARAAGHLG